MKPSLLLGLILVREGIISDSQLRELLAEQARRRAVGQVVPLGQLVMARGCGSEQQVRYALQLQQKLAWAPGGAVPLGVRLVAGGLLAPSLLVSLMAAAERGNQTLEQLLTERDLISSEIIRHVKQLAT